ncbi:MAG: thioesterase family protein [Alkaliphilus sp.]
MKGQMNLHEGMSYTMQKRVDYGDMAVSFGRKGVETLFSTTALSRMMIKVALEVTGNNLAEGYITVAKKLELTHEKPTLQGMTITIKAVLEKIDGNVLHFKVVCYDELGKIASGVMERHVVNKQALLERAHRRADTLQRRS